MTLRTMLVAMGILLALAVAPARAQDEPLLPPADEAAPGDANNSLPSLGNLVDMVNRSNDGNDPNATEWSSPIKLAVVFAGLAILPSLLVMTTSFTRIIIVLSFVRRALSTQTIPPTIAVVGLSLFLTVFTMAPTFGKVNQKAIQPYLGEQISFSRAGEVGNLHMKEFMIRQTRRKDMELFLNMADAHPRTVREIPLHVVIPAFAISEFRTAFEMGCLLFIPFLLIDLIIAGILLSAGMMMLPPMMVSLPFKIILFVLVDGWQLVIEGVVRSFH